MCLSSSKIARSSFCFFYFAFIYLSSYFSLSLSFTFFNFPRQDLLGTKQERRTGHGYVRWRCYTHSYIINTCATCHVLCVQKNPKTFKVEYIRLKRMIPCPIIKSIVTSSGTLKIYITCTITCTIVKASDWFHVKRFIHVAF